MAARHEPAQDAPSSPVHADGIVKPSPKRARSGELATHGSGSAAALPVSATAGHAYATTEHDGLEQLTTVARAHVLVGEVLEMKFTVDGQIAWFVGEVAATNPGARTFTASFDDGEVPTPCPF